MEDFTRNVFRSLREVERLREWLTQPHGHGPPPCPGALGPRSTRRGGSPAGRAAHNPAIATCLSKSYLALGKHTEAVAVLTQKTTDPAQTSAWLSVLEAQRDTEGLASNLQNHGDGLPESDHKYFQGVIKEQQLDPEGAIAFYDEALSLQANHRAALFRLAVNVDLRGEDEEARELYEKALMMPPVNVACVMNLGILYEDMGNYRRAMQCFDLALQANPENRRARMYRRDAAAALNMYYDEDQERREDKRNKILRTPINDFELSVRSRNCLAKITSARSAIW